MDAEISADGRRLYYTDNLWRADGPPRRSVFRLARRTAAGWRTDPTADVWFARINTGGLQYAAGLSADELEFFSIKVADGPLTSRLQKIEPGDQILLAKKPTGTLVLDALKPGAPRDAKPSKIVPARAARAASGPLRASQGLRRPAVAPRHPPRVVASGSATR